MRMLLIMALLFSQAAVAEQAITFGVHSNTPPIEWQENGEQQGFTVELLERIGELSQRPITLKRKTFNALIHEINQSNREIDVIAVVSPVGLPRSNQQSDPIYATYAKAYANSSETLVGDWSALKGKRVAIKVGSMVDIYLADKSIEFERIDVDLYETGFELMRLGEVEIVLAEKFVARRLLPQFPLIRSVSDPLIYGTFNYVAHSDSVELMEQINQTLRLLKLTGEYDLLVRKWFGDGSEKVELTSTQRGGLLWAVAIAVVSLAGMLLTWRISFHLRRQTKELDHELKSRRSAEQHVSQLSQQFQSVLDGLPHGVYLYDSEQQLLWSNNKQLEILKGMSAQSLAAVVGAGTKGGAYPRLYDFEQSRRHWQLQAHPIANNQVVLLLQDVTEQQQLRQANEQASRLASLGELSAGVAHEINNPTGLIVHAVALLRDAFADLKPAVAHYQQYDPFWQIAGLAPAEALPELANSSNDISDAAERIARIVNDLKRYAHPGESNAFEPVEFNSCIEAALRLTSNYHKRYQLSLQLSSDPLWIYGDGPQLQQVLVNLLHNACIAMADNSDQGQLTITTERQNGYVIVVVADNGCGMDSATLARVKEPFFTSRRASGGTGLGLSVCNRIINEHQGKWWFSSSVAEGTTVKLQFKEVRE